VAGSRVGCEEMSLVIQSKSVGKFTASSEPTPR
jgi:hypothetical protein